MPLTAVQLPAPLKAPFPYPGGKSVAAGAIWARLGDTPNAVEPFCGSSAWTLARPHDLDKRTETINDADGLLVNSLRSIAADPEQTAHWCDWPVSECDLTSRHLWLKAQRDDLTARLFADPDYYDPKAAGWWLWGIASWIGDGWCVADGPWIAVDGKLCDRRTIGSEEAGVRKKIPSVGSMKNEDGHGGDGSKGIQRYRNAPGVPKKMPEIGKRENSHGGSGPKGVLAYRQSGVQKQMPAISPQGGGTMRHQGVQAYRAGVPKKMPEVGKSGYGQTTRGINTVAPAALLAYFDRLATRLRRVRILCGDWRRVVKPSITTNHGLTAIFMDPPYPHAEHDMAYHGDGNIWHDAAHWAVENGDNPLLRIAICGYHSDQTDALFDATWTRYRWQARGGYSNQRAAGRGRENAKRECVWFSPHCLEVP